VCETGPDARFEFNHGALLPIMGRFSFSPTGEPPLCPEISAPGESLPGGLLRIITVSADRLDRFSVRLNAPGGGVVSRTTGFLRERGEAGELWIALLGVPADARKGEYRLDTAIASGARSCVVLTALVVLERAFPAEKISLDGDLALLRTSSDPRKVAEAKQMSEVLSTAHPDALYETGTFENPLPSARRSAGYGDRREYLYAETGSDFSIHSGIDLAAPEGTMVPACGKGTVVFTGERLLTGWSVAIEHLPGLFSLYYHMSGILVRKGDLVEKGQVVGFVGKTGLATGPHLHWEVRALGTAVDPDMLTQTSPYPARRDPPVLDKSTGIGTFESSNSTEGR
jgi:murein DD-endopeptidase MepM/ murein hydrolase activator NlpD